MTARRDAPRFDRLAQSLHLSDYPDPRDMGSGAPTWDPLTSLAKAIQRAARRAGLDRKRGGLGKWHRMET